MKFITLLLIMFSFCGCPVAAQSTPQIPNSETEAEKPPEKKPKMKAPKTVKDLDAFFKEGEDQIKDGPRCDKPPAPTV